MKVRLKKKNILVALISLLCFMIFVFIELRGTLHERADLVASAREFTTNVTTVDLAYASDPFRAYLVRENNVHNKQGATECLEKRNLVFIKTMKCATQTSVQMLRRFGYRRLLNFVLPKQNRIYLGWPFIIEAQDYRESARQFNILVDHSVYNETAMRKIMPRDTQYITIIREPWSHFKSSFNYFNIANLSLVEKVPDQITEYLHNVDAYDKFYKSEEAAAKRFCIPNGFSVTKNLMSHCLGMPLGFPKGRENIEADDKKVQDYINTLDKNFALIMIMEYFHESLVLLKRIMCWSMEDILYHTSNVANYSSKFEKSNPDNLAIFKQRSHIDFRLYDHFNRTFWTKVRDQGDDFFPEVAIYNNLQARVTKYCSSDKTNPMTIPASVYHREIVLDKDYCILLGIDLLMMLKTRADVEEDYNPYDVTAPPNYNRGC